MISDEDVLEITQAFVQIANEGGGLNQIVEQYRFNRSLAIRVLGTRIRTGFIIKDGKIQMLSDLDHPTVTVTLDKTTYWDIINSKDAKLARAKIYAAVFTEEGITMEPPPGTQGGALHLQNVMAVFSKLSQLVMGEGN